VSNNWSLKGKIKRIDEGYGWGEFQGFNLDEDEDGGVYKVEAIETLRQKLIDDVLELSLKYVKYSDVIPASIPPGEVKKIINKRFGVDE